MTKMLHRELWVTALLLSAAGCGMEGGLEVADRDFAQFRDEVYPVLMRDCAFHTCHGNAERFYRITGSARGRLDMDVKALAETRPEEIEFSYWRSLAMINVQDPGASLLLRKPLASSLGGTGHLGTDSFGRNVFESTDNDDYLTIAKWVFGER